MAAQRQPASGLERWTMVSGRPYWSDARPPAVARDEWPVNARVDPRLVHPAGLDMGRTALAGPVRVAKLSEEQLSSLEP